MAVDFETPTAALFARLQLIDGLQYATRVLEDWNQSASAKQPALYLTSDTIVEFTPNSALAGKAPPMWKMNLLVVLYVQSPDPNTAPSAILNPLIAGVCNALVKTVPEKAATGAQFVANAPGQFSTTLGGLCAYCRVAGKIEISEGLGGRESAAHIPLELVLSS